VASETSFEPVTGLRYSPVELLESSLGSAHSSLERDPPVPYNVLASALAEHVLDRPLAGYVERLERAAAATRADGTDWELSRRLEILTAARLLNHDELFKEQLDRAESIEETARKAAARMPARLEQYLNARMALCALRSRWADALEVVRARRQEPPLGEPVPLLALTAALQAKGTGSALPGSSAEGLALLSVSGDWTTESVYAAWACALLTDDLSFRTFLGRTRGALKPLEDECFQAGNDRQANFQLGESEWSIVENGLAIGIPIHTECKLDEAIELIALKIVHRLTSYLDGLFTHRITHPRIRGLRRKRDLRDKLNTPGAALTVELTPNETTVSPDRLVLGSFLLNSLAQWMSVQHSLNFSGRFVAAHQR